MPQPYSLGSALLLRSGLGLHVECSGIEARRQLRIKGCVDLEEDRIRAAAGLVGAGYGGGGANLQSGAEGGAGRQGAVGSALTGIRDENASRRNSVGAVAERTGNRGVDENLEPGASGML